jgi:hypothetical protein
MMDRFDNRLIYLVSATLLVLNTQGLLVMAAAEKMPHLRPPAEVQGWQLDAASSQTITPKTIFKYMDGAGELYLAYQFQKLHAWTYQRDGGTTITVEAFDMGVPQDAFGVFSHDPAGKEVEIGQQSSYAMGFLQFWKERWYVRIVADEETPESRRAVLALGRKFAAQVTAEGEKPEILKRLPPKGLEPDSIRFFHTQVCLNMLYFFAVENLLDLGDKTDVVMADYRLDKQSAKLLIVRYPTASDAAAARAKFVNGYLPEVDATSDSVQIAQIENDEWVAVRLEKDYLAVAFKSRSRDVCETLVRGAKLKRGGKKR